MPVNYQQFQDALKQIGELAPKRQEEHEALLARVLAAFEEAADKAQQLNERLESCINLNQQLRTAVPPEDGPINAAISETEQPEDYTIWAADGSQVIPNQHLAVPFGLINVGLVRFSPGDFPSQKVETKLLYDKDLYTEQGYLVGEEYIALRRDFRERELLLNNAREEKGTVITLTDGPLELFREPKEDKEYQSLIKRYQSVLSQMADENILTAGYVDKPQGDLLVRLLELTQLEPNQLADAGKLRPFVTITDAEVFSRLLKPGERSAVFRVHASTTNKYFTGRTAIHFFYLNVAQAGAPQLARVEVPQWVLKDPANLNLIQNYLLKQSRQMGPRAYPYILHRAHETAVVTFQERQQLELLIQQELLKQGMALSFKSGKQNAKDQPNPRYK